MSAVLGVVAFSGAAARVPTSEGNQEAVKSVWDGVFTAAQADKGRAEYEQHCATCHSTGEGPVLTGDAFMRRWFEDNLNAIFTKVRTTMPGDAPGSLTDPVYLQVITYLLQASGFPPGDSELVSSPEVLAKIQIVDKGGPGGQVPNFSLVQVIGCLAQRGDGWILEYGTEPARTREAADSSPLELKASVAKPLGTQVFRLMDLSAQSGAAQTGRKVQVKGFLIRQPDGSRLNVVSLQGLDANCPQ